MLFRDGTAIALGHQCLDSLRVIRHPCFRELVEIDWRGSRLLVRGILASFVLSRQALVYWSHVHAWEGGHFSLAILHFDRVSLAVLTLPVYAAPDWAVLLRSIPLLPVRPLIAVLIGVCWLSIPYEFDRGALERVLFVEANDGLATHAQLP